MASAYATLASGGVKREPTVITKILDRDGNVIWPQEESDTGERVLDEKVAAATTKVLETVFTQSNGTATSARLNSGQPVCRQDGHRQLVHRPLAGGLYAQPVVRGLDRRPVRRY
mgnify:CR=1 FL=1